MVLEQNFIHGPVLWRFPHYHVGPGFPLYLLPYAIAAIPFVVRRSHSFVNVKALSSATQLPRCASGNSVLSFPQASVAITSPHSLPLCPPHCIAAILQRMQKDAAVIPIAGSIILSSPLPMLNSSFFQSPEQYKWLLLIRFLSAIWHYGYVILFASIATNSLTTALYQAIPFFIPVYLQLSMAGFDLIVMQRCHITTQTLRFVKNFPGISSFILLLPVFQLLLDYCYVIWRFSLHTI